MLSTTVSLLLSLTIAAQSPTPAASPPPAKSTVAAGAVSLYFSPGGGATKAVVDRVNSAKTSVRVLTYVFTSPPIAEAVIAAKKRGVDVVVVLDKSQAGQRYSAATHLFNAGITPRVDGVHAIQHNKVIVIDDRVVITGSFNFSSAAEKSNAENLVIFENAPRVAAVYAANFTEHFEHSAVYVGLKEPATDVKNQPEKVVKPAADDAVVYITKSGSKYHAATCRHARNGFPVPRSEALSRHLTPCDVCGGG